MSLFSVLGQKGYFQPISEFNPAEPSHQENHWNSIARMIPMMLPSCSKEIALKFLREELEKLPEISKNEQLAAALQTILFTGDTTSSTLIDFCTWLIQSKGKFPKIFTLCRRFVFLNSILGLPFFMRSRMPGFNGYQALQNKLLPRSRLASYLEHCFSFSRGL